VRGALETGNWSAFALSRFGATTFARICERRLNGGRLGEPVKLEAGSWKLETGNWKLETGNWKLEAEIQPPVPSKHWELETGNW